MICPTWVIAHLPAAPQTFLSRPVGPRSPGAAGRADRVARTGGAGRVNHGPRLLSPPAARRSVARSYQRLALVDAAAWWLTDPAGGEARRMNAYSTLLNTALKWCETDEKLVSRCSRGPRSGADVDREVRAGEGGAGGDEVGGCALEDDPAAVVAGAGTEVDDPVGVRHDRLVVRDDDDRLAGVDEPVEQAEQLLDVGEVEAGGRLVEDVDAALLGHAGGQLEPLPLAAGQRGERLAEAEVAEPDVGEPVEDGVRGRCARLAGAEELLGLGHRHREHLADVAAAEVVLQHRCLEPLALALLAGGGDAGHHRQVGVDDADAVAVGAGALGVGAEQRRLHAVGLRERLADRVEQSGVRRRVAP